MIRLTAWPAEDGAACLSILQPIREKRASSGGSDSFFRPLQSTRFLKAVSSYSWFYNPPCLIAEIESGPASPRAWSRTESRCLNAPHSNHLYGCALASPARGKVEGFSTRVVFYITILVQFKKTPNRRAGSRSLMGFQLKQVAFNENLQKVILKSPRKFTRRIEKKREVCCV